MASLGFKQIMKPIIDILCKSQIFVKRFFGIGREKAPVHV